MIKNFTLTVLFCLSITGGLLAQRSPDPALTYLRTHYAELGLEAADVDELRVTDNYLSPNGARHVYVEQRLHGLPVFNAQASLHYKGDRLVHKTNGLAANLASVPAPAPALSAQTAAANAAVAVAPAFGRPVAIGSRNGEELFAWPAVSDQPLRVRRGYLATATGLRLAYEVTVDRYNDHDDHWTILVDATDGTVLEQHNAVVKCSFGNQLHHHATTPPAADRKPTVVTRQKSSANDGAAYRVFAFGLESPNHGERTLEVNPADSVASPFGWHDTNGQPGPEFTITRGNNVYAYPDRDDDNEPDNLVPADGGDSLQFDFFYEDEASLDTLLPAAVTQLFYTTNIVHDWLHYAGFDEAAGNFQRRNYTDDGRDRDFILAEAQDGADLNDGEHNGNANFFTPNDGFSPRMQMFKFNRSSASVLSATHPASATGPYVTGDASFGGEIDETPLTGQVVYSAPADACAAVSEDVDGKVALITRGTCEFGTKILNAERAGAIAVIMCNNVAENDPSGRGGTIRMGPGADGGFVTIPAVFLSLENCVPLRTAIEAGDSVSVTFQDLSPGPLDGDFDSGIVAHEIGHGVSNRLVGGPGRSNCLRNDEQMGEGWSDFFALAYAPRAVTATPDGSEARGIGTFATDQATTGRGIRRQPYSTSRAVNNYTYDDVIWSGDAPHPLGEVWASTLWDLYWAMVDDYGFDDDLYTGSGGNNLAVQLVVEGLKTTKCNPGLTDGRDGILAADEFLNDGANVCRIWEIFAARGIGFSAEQGSTADRTDNRQAFDMPPSCIGGVQLVKQVDKPTVDAGEDITITLVATNYSDDDSGKIQVTDNIPAGLTVDQSSIRGAASFNLEDGRLVLELDNIAPEEQQTVRYTATTDPELASRVSLFDDIEEVEDKWEAVDNTENPDDPTIEFNAFWEISDTMPFRGEFSYFVLNTPFPQNQALQLIDPVELTAGSRPALRFFTAYQTEAGWDAGIVEVSTNGRTWDKVDGKLVRGAYDGEISPDGLASLQGVSSFWGDSDGYREIVVDLSDYAGESVFIRFSFQSDAAARVRGWWIDDIQIIDNVVNYDAPATLVSAAGDNFTTTAGDLGTLVFGDVLDNTDDPLLGQTEVKVFPNPAENFVNVAVSAQNAGEATVDLLSVDGRLLSSQRLRLLPGDNQTTLNTGAVPAGLYLIRVTGAERISTTKVTIN